MNAVACKGTRLRAGTGRVKHRSTEQLWVQSVLRAGTGRVKHRSTEQLWVQAVLERLPVTVRRYRDGSIIMLMHPLHLVSGRENGR